MSRSIAAAKEPEVSNCERLESAIAAADLRVLLMVLFQMTGDESWLAFRPKRDVKLISDEDAGLSPQEQAEIRAAAFALLSKDPKGSPAISDPGDSLMQRMMSVCLGEEVPAEYAPLMREELGFVSRDFEWTSTPPEIEDFPILIIGAGVSGIGLGARLERLGIPYTILERHGEVGGVWWENRYPGAGVDTPNHSYSYSFGTTYPWTRYFSTRTEVFDYLRRSADAFGVRPRIRFGTSVLHARWDEKRRRWRVGIADASGRSELEAAVLVSAIGQFGLPSIPRIDGADSFKGPIFHSSDWPADIDLRGKRLALIGTGASAMQIVPTVVDDVASVAIYQRTPQWARSIARYQDGIGPAQWLLDQVPLYAAWFRFTMWWRYGDGLLPILRKDPEWPHPQRSLNKRNDRHREEMTAHIRTALGDRKDLIAKCVPDYPPFGKRILLDSGWYEAIKKPQVELVTDPIEHITQDAVVTADGEQRKADIIVYATGFQVAALASRLNIQGRNGLDLTEAWADENPKAYKGISVTGFPNFFMMQGPNTGLGHGGSAIFQAESQARYISAMIVKMLEDGIETVEVKSEAMEGFVDLVDREHEQLIWTHPGVSTYYRNKHGRVVSVMPFRLVDYWQMTREPDLHSYDVEPRAGLGDGK